MRIPLPAVALAVASALAVPAGAQVTYLQNDSYGGGAVLCYQGINLFQGLASKFTAQPTQYPYTIHSIRVFGCGGGLDAYVIQIFEDNGTAAPGPVIWNSQNAYFLSGNNTFNDILLSNEPIPPPPITSGSIRVLLVNDSILTPIGFGADLNGIQPTINTIRNENSVWSFAENPPYNVNGDFVLRLGVNASLEPSLRAIDVTVPEGTGGTSDAVFTVQLEPTSSQEVTVLYATANDTAIAPEDYTAGAGILTFPPGVGVRTVLVPIVGDALDEPGETFTLNLGSATNAVIADGTAVGTIQDDDVPVSLAIADMETIEGDGGLGTLAFPVTLSGPSAFPVTVGFATTNGTAAGPGDFVATSGTLSFPAGETQRSVQVSIVRDLQDEADEAFEVALSSPANATLGDASAAGLIRDDDLAVQQELDHGTTWTGSLASHPGPAPDVDAYAIAQAPGSSYEVLVDMASGDLGTTGPLLDRFDTATSTVVQSSAPIGVGHGRVLRWQNPSTAVVTGEQVRVRSGQCTTDCGTDDLYRLRVLETTLRASRFNNVGTQVTVVQVQNTTNGAVEATLWFWGADGSPLGSHALTLSSFGSETVNTSALPGLAGQGGSLTVSSNAPYGGLVGKAVALEPATGLVFETGLDPRPR
jgi:Calx-beta domain-containing protein